MQGILSHNVDLTGEQFFEVYDQAGRKPGRMLWQPMVKEPPEPPPVVDYHSHYVLFPQGTPWSWYDASRHYLIKFRATRGESCNDAARAHGTLGHVITCINPTPEVIEYLKQLNPDASLDFIYAQTTDDLEDIMDHRADIGEPW